MKRILVGVLLSTILLYGTAFAVPVQWAVSDGGNDHWYELIDSSIDWNDARLQAELLSYESMRGHLVSITSQEENNWIWLNLGSPTGYFIGGTDSANEGDWEWITGETWSFQNWNSGEPNNVPWAIPSGEDAIEFAGSGFWNDIPVTNYSNRGYIVEYEASPVPEPATTLLLGSGLIGLAGFRRKFKKG